MTWFTRKDRDVLRAILEGVHKMSVDVSKLQAAVSQLSTDVTALIALVPNPSADAAVQAQIDAVTTSLSSLDAAVKAAETAPAPTGATGPASA